MARNKKELIRQAAIDVIAEEGFHNATTDKIAVVAGISVGLVYYYFKNKEEILEYIFQMEYERRGKLLEELEHSKMHPVGKLEKMLWQHFDIVKKDHKVAKIILRERHLPFCIQGGVKQFGGVPKFIQRVIEDGIKAGHLRPCNAEIIAIAVYGIIEEVINQYIIEKDQRQKSHVLDMALSEIVDFLSRGLSYN